MKRLGLVVACLSFVAVACVHSLPPTTPGTAGFPNGVAAGDVTDAGATLWTRTAGAATVQLDVYDAVLQPNMAVVPGPSPIFTTSSTTAVANDYTTKVAVGDLQPHAIYFYRFSNGSEHSQLGRFVTAPAPDQAASFRFVVAADADGFPVGGPPGFNNFEVLNRARVNQPDFFAFLGNTIYSDSTFGPGGVDTIGEYRDAHEQNRSLANLRNLMSATGTFAQFGDHEVYNDFDGETVGPARYAAGIQAFNDWMPTNTANVLNDPTCAGGHPRYFHQKWGTQAEIFLLDERSCRSSQGPVKTACTHPSLGLDFLPTLLSPVRNVVGLPPSPPAGCLAAINSSSRTFLGPVQKAAFKADLLASTAKFKIILGETAMQRLYLLPYDGWEGYGAERREVLNHIRNNDIDNVVFLSTDARAPISGDVFIDNRADPIAYEATIGPIAATTYRRDMLAKFPSLDENIVTLMLALLDLTDCKNFDVYSYQLVEVNAAKGTLTISSRDEQGDVVREFPRTVCRKTLR